MKHWALAVPSALLALTLAAAAQQRPAPRITAAVNPARRVVLAGQVSPRALRAADAGPVAANLPIRLVLHFAPTPAQQAGLDALLAAQRDPASPDYQRWLTPEQFGQRFGAAPADIATIAAWLQHNGLGIAAVARAANYIVATGPASAVEQAFAVPLHNLVSDGERHYANLAPPSIPAALAPVLSVVTGFDDFRPHRMARRLPQPFAPTNLTPQALASAYDLTPLQAAGMDGKGQTLVVVGQSQIQTGDLAAFRSQFGLTGANPTVTLAPGTTGDPGVTDDMIEADLDLEWSEAVAPAATTQYVYAQNVFDAAQYAIDQNLGSVMSISFGACETQNTVAAQQFFETIFQQANAEGMSIFVSSGDTGAANCEDQTSKSATTGLAVSFPATLPEATGVGGTAFNSDAQAGAGYPGESVWNDTALVGALSASGGGVSTIFPEPSWQKGIPGVPASPAFRFLPDVALSASPNHDPYLIVTAGKSELVGGTSASTPVLAAGVILLNQYLLAHGQLAKPGLGNINPKLYALSQTNPAAFHDITTGDNKVPCTIGSTGCSSSPIGFAATVGYDEATGLGSLDFNQLFLAWSGGVPKVPITLSVGTLDFGNQVVNTASATQTVTVSNNSSSAVAFTSIAASGDFAAANTCGASLAANATCTATVTFTPTATGARAGTLTFTDSASNSPQTVALTGTGTSATPAATLSATSLDFGTQLVGTTATQTITVTNSGGVPLQFASITASTGFTTVFQGSQSCLSQLAAGGSCTIAVAYAPTATGSAAGTLTLTDNAPNSPQTVALTANAGDFTVAAGQGGSTSATVTAGGTATYTLALSSSNGLSAQAAVTCSGAPATVTCTANPNGTALSSTPATITITAATTARGSALPFWLVFFGGLGGLLALSAWLVRARPRRARVWATAGAMATVVLLVGCGGGGGGGGGGSTGGTTQPTGTPAGTYTLTATVTVRANGQNVSHTLPLTLIVQ